MTTSNHQHEVTLTYQTPRGPWYDISWKGDMAKSGGMITNIGVHLFDLLLWIFGPVVRIDKVEHSDKKASGNMQLKKATVRWSLSTEFGEKQEAQPRRIIDVDGTTIAFDKGFNDLHTVCYEQILSGNIVSSASLRTLIQLMWELRQKRSSH